MDNLVKNLEITGEDLANAYEAHTSWWLDPAFTPIAIALKRLGKNATAGYKYVTIDGVSQELSKEAVKYQLDFGFSLYDAISDKTLATIKQLHKSNSDWKNPVVAHKKTYVEATLLSIV